MPPRLIPVVDVMNGQVVRAVGGRRSEYRPLSSRLISSTEPLAVAAAMLRATGASELYLADLDAIMAQPQPRWELYSRLEALNIPIWWDGGFGPTRPIPDLQALPHLRPVLGFETCRTPEVLKAAVSAISPDRIAFSIDLSAGKLLGDWKAWGVDGPGDSLGLAKKTLGFGCRHLIVLDLSRVGLGSGCGTELLLRAIRSECPAVDLMAGGGIRTMDDVQVLDSLGVNAVLIASAIHDRAIKLF